MFRFLFLFTIIASVVFHAQVSAQKKGGTIVGTVADSSGHKPLVGAYVSVVSPRDTLHLTTGIGGGFATERLRDSAVRLTVTYLGFEDLVRDIRIGPGVNRLDTLYMHESSVDVDAVVVHANRPMMSQRGDTLIYHPENIRVLPGDETMQIIIRLPGMEVKDGSIKFMGKTIERTYVDGKPLFGENAQSALDYLAANEVADIQVYEEIAEKDRITGDKNVKKRTVLNLITKNKIQKSINVEALASYGVDIDPDADGRHRPRYGAGASYRYFSEKKIYMADANSNNNNQNQTRMRGMLGAYSGSQGDRRNTSANANFTRRFSEQLTLGGNYSYNNSYSRTQNIVEQIYFPSELYDSRTYRDTTRQAARTENHNVGAEVRYNTKNDYFTFSPSFQLSRNTSDSYRGASNVLDGETINRVAADDRSKDRSHSVSANLMWNHSFKNNPRRSFSLSFNGSSGNNDGEGWRVDSLASDNGRTFLETNANGWNNTVGGNASYSEPIGEKNYLRINYNISYEKSKSARIAVDRFTGQIDTTLTYDYSRNYTTQNGGLGFSRNTEKINVSVDLAYQSARLNKDEAFPEIRDDRYTFRNLLPSATFSYQAGPTTNLYVNYYTSAGQPSVEQLRNELDNQNKLSLSGGNPNLRQSFRQGINIGFYKTTPETSRMYGLSLGANIVSNDIASKRIFFTQDTPLPDYNGYVAVKGSTLTLPVNVNGAGNLFFSGRFSAPVKFLGATFNASTGVSYNRRPNYIEDALDYTNTLSPNIGLGLTSNKSTVFQFFIYSNTAYNHSTNSLRDGNNTISETVSANITVNFLKHAYFGTDYYFNYYHNFSYPDGDVNTNRLSLTLGCKLMKNRQLDIGILVYDLLNSTQNFSSGMMSDYISNRWSQTFGRYFSVAVGYKFNKTGQLRQKK